MMSNVGMTKRIVKAYPNLVVQIPIMPQSGIMIVTTLVMTNCDT